MFEKVFFFPHKFFNDIQGLVIERIQNSLSAEGKNKIIYLGDGNGDFCPVLKLKDSDYLMPRKDFPLSDLISKNSNKIKAQVHDWRDGKELEHVLLHVINKAIGEENNINTCTQKVSVDCKLGPIPIDTHQSLPKVLSVPH